MDPPVVMTSETSLLLPTYRGILDVGKFEFNFFYFRTTCSLPHLMWFWILLAGISLRGSCRIVSEFLTWR